MIKGVHHAGLSVNDLEGAVAFYRDAAGLNEVQRFSLEDDEQFSATLGCGKHTAEVVLLEGSNAFLAVARFDNPNPGSPEARPVCDAGITHICSQAREIKMVEARYREAGACFREDPVALGTGTIYAYVEDPESNIIELEGTYYAPESERPWLAHVAWATHDIDRLPSFYAKLLGREISRTSELNDNPLADKITGFENTHVKAAWIEGENQILELWQYLNPPTLARNSDRSIFDLGWAYCCFEVEDIHGEYERIKSIGARFITAPRAFRGAEICFARDPDGNLFSLLEIPADKRRLSLDSVEDRTVIQRSAMNRPGQKESAE